MDKNGTYYRNIFKKNHSVMLLIIPETYEIYDCNDAACSFCGYSYDDIRKLKITDLNVLTNKQIARVMNLAKDQNTNHFFFNQRLSNGEVRNVEVNSSKIILEGRKLLFWIIFENSTDFYVNVTERIEVELALKKSEEQYRLLFNNAVEAIFVIQNTDIKICNPMATELTGYQTEELSAMSFRNLVFSEDIEEVIDFHKERLMGKRENEKYIFRIIRKDGKIRWVESDGIKILWENAAAALNFVIDITERKEAEDGLKKNEEKYRFLTEYASDIIWVLNIKNNRYTYISPAVFQLRGITAEEAINETLEESLTPQSLDVLKDAISRNVVEFIKNPLNPNYYINEIQQPCKDGRVISVEVSTKFRYNPEGEIEVVGVSRDIEERKKVEEQVLYLSYYDQLTGLYNRRFYEEQLKRLDTQRNFPITLIMADVNGLKLVNDAFGHIAGDKLLKNVGEILKNEVRSDAIVARIGGDEFVVLLPKANSSDAELIVERIRELMLSTKVGETILSVSFGWATKSNSNENLEDIFTQAENYMYRRKLLESNSMKGDTVKLITKSLFEKDDFEQNHCEKVSEISKKIGKAMGLSTNKINELGLLGLLHDIGKIGISEELLCKQTELNKEEWREIKRHSETGYQILRSVNEFAHISEYVLCHHERVDGKGYPKGLKKDQIPLQSKILCIADAFESMTNGRAYRDAMSDDEAVKELLKNTGTQFDSEIVKVFVEKVLTKM